MKYKRMFCWVRPHEKKELKEAVNGQFPLVFAKNYEDFKSQIKKNDFLVMSIVKAVRGLRKIQELVRLFSKNYFYLYYRSNKDGFMTDNEMILFEEKNIVNGQFTPLGLIQSYFVQPPDSHPPRHISEDELIEIWKTHPTLRKLAQAVSEEFDENGKYIGKY